MNAYELETMGGRFVVIRSKDREVVASCMTEESGRAALRLLSTP